MNLPPSSRTQLALKLCDERCIEISTTVINKQITEAEKSQGDDNVNEDQNRKVFRLTRLNTMLLNKQLSDPLKLSKDKYWTMSKFDKDEL